MFAELDKIALTTALPLDYKFMVDVPPKSPLLDSPNGGGLIPGDVGTVVDVQGGGEWLCVEFLEYGGYTVALADMPASCARPAYGERYSQRAVSAEEAGSEPLVGQSDRMKLPNASQARVQREKTRKKSARTAGGTI